MSILDKLASAARAIPGAVTYADAVRTAAHTPTAALDAAQNAVQRAYAALPESARAAVQQVASEVRNGTK